MVSFKVEGPAFIPEPPAVQAKRTSFYRREKAEPAGSAFPHKPPVDLPALLLHMPHGHKVAPLVSLAIRVARRERHLRMTKLLMPLRVRLHAIRNVRTGSFYAVVKSMPLQVISIL